MGHQQALALPADKATLKSYENNLRELRQRGAFAKVSGLHRPRTAVAGTPPDPKDYLPVMDFLWDIFGEDKLVYSGRGKTSLEILRNYFLAKGRPAAEKYLWKNSVAAFRWVRRDPSQPSLG